MPFVCNYARVSPPCVPQPPRIAPADEIVAQIVAAENLAPITDTRSDEVLARAIAAGAAGGVDEALQRAREEERAREARMRDLKAVQKRIDEVRAA